MEQKITTILHMALSMAKEQDMISQEDLKEIAREFYQMVDYHTTTRNIPKKEDMKHPVGGDEDLAEIKALAFDGVKNQ